MEDHELTLDELRASWRPDWSQEEMNEWYDKVAHQWDKTLTGTGFSEGGRALVETLSTIIPDKNARILDCAAGTGVVGIELLKSGYQNIDALEPSENMIKVAKKAKIYKKYVIEPVVPDRKLGIEDDLYDGICISGSFLPAHITYECLPQLMRIVRKGGVIIFNIGDHFSTRTGYKDEEIQAYCQNFVDRGEWSRLTKSRGQYNATEKCNIYTLFK